MYIFSFHIAKATIRFSNVQLKKEWLVAKEKKLAIIDRVKNGENKYEELWQESKSRYESLPYVQKLLKAAETAQSIKDQITTLDQQAESLEIEIQAKKEACAIADRKRVIEIAEFVVRERPKMIDIINEKSQKITNLITKLKDLNIKVAETKVAKIEEAVKETNVVSEVVEESKNIDEVFLVSGIYSRYLTN